MERRRVCFRSSGAPARPLLKGRPFIHPTFPRDTPKIRRATLKRFCPAGANSVDPAHWQHILAPRGKDASFFPHPFLPHWRPVSRTAPPPQATKKAQASFFQRGKEPEALLSPPSPPTPTAALRARADIRRPCGAYPCREAAPLRRATHRPGRPRLLLLDENPGAGRYLRKARAGADRKTLPRERRHPSHQAAPRNAFSRRKRRSPMPFPAVFSRGGFYSLAAVL